MANDRSFLGTGWSFPPTFRRSTHSVDVFTQEDDIKSSLEILLSTRVGERVMQPKFGCNMDRLLFEPLDTSLQAYMKDLIRTAILYFEPRIILDNVVLEPVADEGKINVRIEFTVATTNTRNNFVYPFYLNEGIEIS